MDQTLRIYGFGWLAALALASGACGDDMSRACTQIGCNDGLTVRLQGAVPTEYTVTVSSPTAATRSRTCSAATPCAGDAVRFNAYTPVEVTVTIAWSGGQTAVTVLPAYLLSRPNGPDCPPECREATIMVQVA